LPTIGNDLKPVVFTYIKKIPFKYYPCTTNYDFYGMRNGLNAVEFVSFLIKRFLWSLLVIGIGNIGMSIKLAGIDVNKNVKLKVSEKHDLHRDISLGY
jgi:hypothetical protein